MKKWILGVSVVLIAAVLVAAGKVSYEQIDQRYPWLWMYLGDQWRKNPTHDVQGPKHILFVFTDHFGPHEQAAMDRWMKSYPEMAQKHADADGRVPQHSWFWYFSQSEEPEKFRFLQQLSQLAFEGYGEVELHMHHYNDTEETFTEKMNQAIQLSQKAGAMITAEPQPRAAFGFIHGLWSLDNSRGKGACGVNNELIVLRKLGCYADFTHPSWGPMHPRMVNRIYYAMDDPQKAKSYDRGDVMKVGKPGLGDLLIFEGPSVVRFNSIRPVYDHGDVTHKYLPTPERIDGWVRAGVHVQDRPEWIFIKVFTHGALEADHEAVLGDRRNQMHTYLEEKYNDGKNYVLHYVTTREAYNIAKAAEAGKTGNPNDYRDFLIPPYVNRFLVANVPFETISYNPKDAVVRFDAEPGKVIDLRMRARDVQVTGDVRIESKEMSEGNEVRLRLLLQSPGVVGLDFGVKEAEIHAA